VVRVKVVRFIRRLAGDKEEKDIVGKKASIIELCRKHRLDRRKCRKYRVVE